MKAVDVSLGAAVGVAGYYGLSLASALWTGQSDPSDPMWSLVLGAVVCVALGTITAWRNRISLIASALMLLLIITGYAAGSDRDTWAAPFPADVLTLYLHGSRSPLVIGPAILVASIAVWRCDAGRRRTRPETQGASETR